LKKLLRILLIQFGKLIYDKKYITGRYFSSEGLGPRWILQSWFWQKFMKYNTDTPWPVSHRIEINNPKNIEFHPDDMHIFHTFGTYYQAINGKIVIGRGTWIAPNVGIITTNHNLYDLEKHDSGKDVILGENCWIGMNSIILPGVVLGSRTIVGAGSVVTKSFPEGNCVIAGSPAKKMRTLNISDKEYENVNQ